MARRRGRGEPPEESARPFLSASRRTDIPAWYAPWLMARLRAGEVVVRNPFNPTQSRRLSLSPEVVRAIFFWTRDPAPLLPFLSEIEALGHRTIFHVTATGLPEALEPHPVPQDRRLDSFRALAQVVGPQRAWWRYDPIVLSDRLDPDWHRRNFEELASKLAGATTRVTISLLDWYRKCERRLAPVDGHPQVGRLWQTDPAAPEVLALVRELSRLAREYGLSLRSCCEPAWQAADIEPGACIDAEAAARLFGLAPVATTDPGQRPHCRCAPSYDLGWPDSCIAGCRYCYSTRSHEAALARYRSHDPAAEEL